MGTKKTPHQRLGGTTDKRARLVRAMLEIASLNRAEYRKVRDELWLAVARSHNRKPSAKLREWSARSS